MRALTIALCFMALTLPAWAQAAGIQLNWTDNSNNETTFKIERQVVPNPVPITAPVVCPVPPTGYVQIATVGTNVTMYQDINLATNTTYCYDVRASNAVGDSGPTNTAGRYVPVPPTVPANPSGLGATPLP